MFAAVSNVDSDDRLAMRFKPAKPALAKLNLVQYLQGTDRQKAQTAMDFALFMLRSYESMDLSLISADPKIVSKIMWADRQKSAYSSLSFYILLIGQIFCFCELRLPFPVLISLRIRVVWSALRDRDTELPSLQQQLAEMRASVDSQFAAVSDLRSVHQQQEGSISTQGGTMAEVEGDMRKVLSTMKQLELAGKSQAASIRALEIASKSQSRYARLPSAVI